MSVTSINDIPKMRRNITDENSYDFVPEFKKNVSTRSTKKKVDDVIVDISSTTDLDQNGFEQYELMNSYSEDEDCCCYVVVKMIIRSLYW